MYYPLATEIGAFYRLVGPDGSVATFNDPFDPSYVGMLTGISGLDGADVRESASDLVEADGGVHGLFFLGRRPVILDARVFGHTSVLDRNIRVDRARRASLGLRADCILSWKPSQRNENFLFNPSAEVDLTNIVQGTYVGASTRTRTTAQFAPVASVASVQVAATAAGQGVSFNGAPLTAGVSYTVSFWVKGNAGGEPLDAYVVGSDGVYYGGTGANTLSVWNATNGWVQRSFTITPTATVNNAQLCVRSTSSGSYTFFVDAARIAPAAQSLTYFDVNSPGGLWQGDPFASASGDFVERFITLRRNQKFGESGGWVKDIQMPMVSEYSYIFGTGLKTVAMSVAAENRGNVPALPLVNITGVSTNPTVSDGTVIFRTTGLTLASGETVQFDMLNHTGVFTAGGRTGQSANRYIDFTATQWVDLDGLGTTQTFSLGGGGSATVAYRDTWA